MGTTVGYEYRSDLLRSLAAENQKVGEARGEAQAVVTVLEARGIAVPDDVRERVLTCTDLAQLDTWLRRAVTANSIDELVQP